MKNFKILGLVLISLVGLKAQDNRVAIETSQYFEFHSNYWFNLHHFLYQKAKGAQLKQLEEYGAAFIDVGEEIVEQGLSVAEKEQLAKAVDYYKREWIKVSLFRQGELRIWLQEQKEELSMEGADEFAELVAILREFDPIYRTKYWPLHQGQNLKVLSKHIDLIGQLESSIVPRMEALAGYLWPKEKVRVDLTAYANWAGAYTPSRPRGNPILSTLDPSTLSSDFIETVFHEGSHLLFSRESAIRSAIYFGAEAKKMPFPRNLWHACQFYLCGRAVQDELAKLEVQHSLIMDKNNIFAEFNTPSFRSIMEKYYQGEWKLEKASDALLDSLKED